MTSVRIACAQIAPAVGDAEGNRRRAHEAVREAIGAGARIVLLPELATSGYVFESAEEARALAQSVVGPALSDWAEEAAGSEAVVLGGFAELGADGAVYNSAVMFGPAGLLAVYRKTHLWDREKLCFEPGGEPAPVVETPFGRIGVAVTARRTQDVPAESIPGYERRNAIAAVLVGLATRAQCQVSHRRGSFHADFRGYKRRGFGIVIAGLPPNSVAFGPANDQLTLTSWNGIRTLDLRDREPHTVSPPTFRDQLIRIVAGPRATLPGVSWRNPCTDGSKWQSLAQKERHEQTRPSPWSSAVQLEFHSSVRMDNGC